MGDWISTPAPKRRGGGALAFPEMSHHHRDELARAQAEFTAGAYAATVAVASEREAQLFYQLSSSRDTLIAEYPTDERTMPALREEERAACGILMIMAVVYGWCSRVGHAGLREQGTTVLHCRVDPRIRIINIYAANITQGSRYVLGTLRKKHGWVDKSVCSTVSTLALKPTLYNNLYTLKG